MKTNLNTKEALAWIALACAAFLFSFTVAFAQDKSKDEKNRTAIKIIKKENGKTTKVDTSFESTDDAAIQKMLKDWGVDDEMSFSTKKSDCSDKIRKVMKFHDKSMTKEEREKLKEEMKDLKEDMKDFDGELKEMRIEILSDDEAGDGTVHSFEFELPEMPDVPGGPGHDEVYFFDDHGKGKIRHHRIFINDVDSLSDEDHVIIPGDEDELPPVFEKEVSGNHGEKVFVYKRSKPVSERMMQLSPGKKAGLKLFPNPNDGKFSVEFHADKKDDLKISVYDNQGKEVYAETIRDFSGDYSNQLDLSGKGKGNYILKIMHGEKTVAEKFVIN